MVTAENEEFQKVLELYCEGNHSSQREPEVVKLSLMHKIQHETLHLQRKLSEEFRSEEFYNRGNSPTSSKSVVLNFIAAPEVGTPRNCTNKQIEGLKNQLLGIEDSLYTDLNHNIRRREVLKLKIKSQLRDMESLAPVTLQEKPVLSPTLSVHRSGDHLKQQRPSSLGIPIKTSKPFRFLPDSPVFRKNLKGIKKVFMISDDSVLERSSEKNKRSSYTSQLDSSQVDSTHIPSITPSLLTKSVETGYHAQYISEIADILMRDCEVSSDDSEIEGGEISTVISDRAWNEIEAFQKLIDDYMMETLN